MILQHILFSLKELSLTPSLLEEREDCNVVAIRVSNKTKNTSITLSV
jgi:hypothetical protein